MELNLEEKKFKIEENIQEKPLVRAGHGKRLLDYIIDIIIVYFLGGLIGGILGYMTYFIPSVFHILDWMNNMNRLEEYLLGMILMLIYYSFFEGIYGFTPAKIITKTRVITEEGEKPSFLNILGRTFCRLIPFNHFSFLNSTVVGWHDKLSRTRVIEDENKKKVLFPLLWTSIILLVGGTFIIVGTVPFDFTTGEESSEIQYVSYAGVSFECNEKWILGESEDTENFTYIIEGEKRGLNNSESFSFTIIHSEVDEEVWIVETLESLKTNPLFKKAQFEEMEDINFQGYSAKSVEYTNIILSETYYGKMIAFTNGDMSVYYFKQADSKEKVENKFVDIEKSLRLEY
jgi:Predicted membrane protein/domain